MITGLIATIGENMMLRRSARASTSLRARSAATCTAALAGAPDLGRIGVLVAVEGAGDQASLRGAGAQHRPARGG